MKQFLKSLVASLLLLHVSAKDTRPGGHHCTGIKKIDRVFRYENKIIFNDDDSDNVYEATIGDIKDTVQMKDMSKVAQNISKIYAAVHFEQLKPCSNFQSNPRFCRVSKLYNNHIFWFGYQREKPKGNQTRQRKMQSDFYSTVKNMGVPSFSYIAGGPGWEISPDTAPNPQIQMHAEAPVGGTMEGKVHQIFTTFFMNFVWNTMIRFHGIAYDAYSDALYTVGTIRDDKIAGDKDAWKVGKYVMFRANFSPHGLIMDSYHAHTFNEEKKGIFSYRGRQYILNADGAKFSVYYEDKLLDESISLIKLFCSLDSPLNEADDEDPNPKRDERVGEYNAQNLIPNVAQYLIPHIPEYVQVLDPQSLEGAPFVALILFLAFAFVLMCLINVFTVLEDIKLDRKMRRRRNRGGRHSPGRRVSRSGSPSRSRSPSRSGSVTQPNLRAISTENSASVTAGQPRGGFSSLFNSSGKGQPLQTQPASQFGTLRSVSGSQKPEAASQFGTLRSVSGSQKPEAASQFGTMRSVSGSQKPEAASQFGTLRSVSGSENTSFAQK